MQITLYQNCRLNKNYQEVFALKPKVLNDNTTIPLVAYLNTLTKKTITIDNVFSENKGVLIFDYNLLITTSPPLIDDIYSFNYMQIIFDDYPLIENFKRYCFIDKIEVRNEVVYLYYSEDYWHSYSNKIAGILPSHLISSRVVNYANGTNLIYACLKEDYDSFNGLKIDEQFIGAPTDNYDLVMQIQPYKMVTIDNNPTASDRKPYFMLIRTSSDARPTRTTVMNLIVDVIANLTTGKIVFNNEDLYYDIGSVYLFPSYFNIDESKLTTAHIIKNDNNTTIANAYFMSATMISNIDTKTIYIDDYKLYEIGTLNNRLKITTNKLASSSTLNIRFQASQLGIGLFLEFQGQFVDITNDFELDIPIKAVSAIEYKQEKLNKDLQEMSLNWSMISKHGNFLKIFGSGLSESLGSMSGGLYNIIGKSGDATVSGLANNISNFGSIRIDHFKKYILNEDAYGFNYGVFGKTNLNIVNCFYGLFIFSKKSKNDVYVKGVINNYGYATDLIIDNSNFANLKIQDANYFQNLTRPINYNVIQFEKSNLYGAFTNEIANILNSILENGIKIWYDYNLNDDTYVVG